MATTGETQSRIQPRLKSWINTGQHSEEYPLVPIDEPQNMLGRRMDWDTILQLRKERKQKRLEFLLSKEHTS